MKTICHQHHCLQTRDVSLDTISSIANEIEEINESNQETPVTDLQDVIQNEHEVQVSVPKVRSAKRIVTKKDIDYSKQYDLLIPYCEELLRANPGSTIIIDVEPFRNPSSTTRQFRRVYICYAAMKRGFKMCGREILGLDGCSLKGPFPGHILSAVGVDGNDGIYPVAFSLVEAETNQSWSWFLESLRDDLELPRNANFTFITNRQKVILFYFLQCYHLFTLYHVFDPFM